MRFPFFRKKRVNRYVCDKPSYAGCYVLMMIVAFGLVGIMFTVQCIRQDPIPQPTIATTYTYTADYCMVCHWPRGEKATKPRYPKHPALSQKRLLDDLIATTGGNP